MIAEDLEPLAVLIGGLKLLDGNPRRGDVDAIERSLVAFGQRKPVVARRDGTVIAGNHTLQAARRLGWSELAVVWVDDDETTANAFALADNRVGDLGSYDEQELLDLLIAVNEDSPMMLEATSWSEGDVERLIARLAPVTPPDEFAEFDDDIETKHECPKCGYEWS